MAKRRADIQITKDNPFDRSDDSGDEGTLHQGTAPPEIMAKRKIAVPRSRKTAEAAGNPFGSLGKPSQPKPSNNVFGSAAPAPSNPFSMLQKPQPPVAQPAQPASSVASAASTTSTTPVHTKDQLRLRGLNASFAASVAKANTASPFENWTEMCEKYIKYAKGLAQSSTEAPKASSDVKFGGNPISSAAKPAPAAGSTEPASSETSKITSTGFKFAGSAGNNATSFQFGDKKVDIQKPTSSAKPAGGFVFNPSGTGEIKSTSAKDSTSSKPTFGFGQAAQTDAKPAFNFGSAKTDTTEAKPAAAAEAKPADKPTFSFGDASSSNNKPAFSFGKPAEDKPSTDKPAFTFGSTEAKTESKAEKPAFSFGKPEDKADSKPAFSFGKPADTTESKPAFSFGKPEDKADSKPTFSFGKPEDKPDSKPAFSFGKPEEKADGKPVFSFGKSGTESKPAFSFSKPDSNGKPSGEDSTEGKPKFQFGTPSSSKSGFSFGTGVNPFGSSSIGTANSTDNKTDAPAKLDASWKPTDPIKIVSNGEPSKDTAESGEPSEEQNDPQTDFGGPGPGEEDEDGVYEKKSKVFELVNGEYKSLGLGLLRLLVHKETRKARALLRAEGSGRVLLNVPLRKAFKYTVVGKGQVKVLDVKPGQTDPTIYLLRVKGEADGQELMEKLEAIKN